MNYSSISDPEAGEAKRASKTKSPDRNVLAFGLAVALAGLAGFAVATKTYSPTTSAFVASPAEPAPPAPKDPLSSWKDTTLIPISPESCPLGALGPHVADNLPNCKDAAPDVKCIDPKHHPAANDCYFNSQMWSVYKRVPNAKCQDDPSWKSWVGGSYSVGQVSCSDIAAMPWFKDEFGTTGARVEGCAATGSADSRSGIKGMEACCQSCGGHKPWNPPTPPETPAPTPHPRTHKPTPNPTKRPKPRPTPNPSPAPPTTKLISVAPLDCPGDLGYDLKPCPEADVGDICTPTPEQKAKPALQCFYAGDDGSAGTLLSVYLKVDKATTTLVDDPSWQGRDDMWAKRVVVAEASDSGSGDDDCTGADCGPRDCRAIADAEWTHVDKHGFATPGPRESMCASVGYTDEKEGVPAYVACAKSCASGDREGWAGTHEICRTSDPLFVIDPCDEENEENNATLTEESKKTCSWVADKPETRCLMLGKTQDWDQNPSKAYAFRSCGYACKTCHGMMA